VHAHEGVGRGQPRIALQRLPGAGQGLVVELLRQLPPAQVDVAHPHLGGVGARHGGHRGIEDLLQLGLVDLPEDEADAGLDGLAVVEAGVGLPGDQPVLRVGQPHHRVQPHAEPRVERVAPVHQHGMRTGVAHHGAHLGRRVETTATR
jgi:hypothetical protein